MKRLSYWIHSRVEDSPWKALKSSRSGPHISHLFSADGLMLFAKVRDDQVDCTKARPDRFCAISGQRVNFHKLLMFCSPTSLNIRLTN